MCSTSAGASSINRAQVGGEGDVVGIRTGVPQQARKLFDNRRHQRRQHAAGQATDGIKIVDDGLDAFQMVFEFPQLRAGEIG